jgi:LPPG:FO 2-phospho-L-lactate transferase
VRVTALAGGTGAAKLLRGLVAHAERPELTIVGNTGDDTVVWGLHVSPDLDTVCYALGGLLDVDRGWGRQAETFHARDAMQILGGPTWFNLGDRDLATHLVRTEALAAGQTLSAITRHVAARLGVRAAILPMSDDPVRTRVRTPDGWLAFQEYFVRERSQPKVIDVEYEGASLARPAPGVLDALAHADVIVVCPSNPVTSIGPILAVPGILDALAAARAPVVAVSPIVGGAAVSGPAGDLMRSRGLPVSPTGVAMAYAPWLSTLVIERSDTGIGPELEALGVRAVLADTIMRDRETECTLAAVVLAAAVNRS